MIYSSVNKPRLTSVKLMTPPSERHLVWVLLNHSILSSVTCLSFFQIEPICWLSTSVLIQQILFELSPIYQWCLSNSVAPHRHLQHLRSASRALQLNLCHACKEDIVLFDNSPVTCQVDLLPLGWTHLPSVAWKLCFDMKSGMSSQRKCPTFSIWQCCCDRGRTLWSFLNNGSDQTEINGALNRFGRWKKLYLHYTLSIFLIRFFLKDNVIICSVLRWWKCGGSFAALTAKQHSIKQLK